MFVWWINYIEKKYLKKKNTLDLANAILIYIFVSSVLRTESVNTVSWPRCAGTQKATQCSQWSGGTISCCFVIELQQLKLSAAWPGIKTLGCLKIPFYVGTHKL